MAWSDAVHRAFSFVIRPRSVFANPVAALSFIGEIGGKWHIGCREVRHLCRGSVIACVDLRFIFGRLFHAGYLYRHFIYSRLRHVGRFVECYTGRFTCGNSHVKLLTAEQCAVYVALERERAHNCRPVVDDGGTYLLFASKRAARQRQLYPAHLQVGITCHASGCDCKFVYQDSIHVGCRRGMYGKEIITGLGDFKVYETIVWNCRHHEILEFAQNGHLCHIVCLSIQYLEAFGEIFPTGIVGNRHMTVTRRQRYRVHHHHIIVEWRIHAVAYDCRAVTHAPRCAITVGINHIPLRGVGRLVKTARVWQRYRLYGVHLHGIGVVYRHRVAFGFNAHLDSVQPACRQVGPLCEGIVERLAGLDCLIYRLGYNRPAVYPVACGERCHCCLARIANCCCHLFGIGIISARRRRYCRNRQVGSAVARELACIVKSGFHYREHILISAHKVHVVARPVAGTRYHQHPHCVIGHGIVIHAVGNVNRQLCAGHYALFRLCGAHRHGVFTRAHCRQVHPISVEIITLHHRGIGIKQHPVTRAVAPVHLHIKRYARILVIGKRPDALQFYAWSGDGRRNAPLRNICGGLLPF